MGLMKSNIFNYEFYKNSSKLESFVYKRYEFKMQKLEYTIETDDLSDISFAVNACFMDYGIDISYDKTINYHENIYYGIEFYNDTELYKEFGKLKRNHMDEFYSIRELYDLMEDKDKAVHLITEYVMKYSSNYKYKFINSNIIYNFSKNIDDFIKNNEYGYFEGICHNFHSTSQIKNWINKTFITSEMIIIDNTLIICEPTDNIKNVNQFEKEELDRLKEIDNARITNIKNNDIQQIIDNCEPINNNTTELNLPISVNDWDLEEKDFYKSKSLGLNDSMVAHLLCTMVRPPIIPSSSCTSLSDDNIVDTSKESTLQNNQLDDLVDSSINNKETDV
jgi:hypothetical protein